MVEEISTLRANLKQSRHEHQELEAQIRELRSTENSSKVYWLRPSSVFVLNVLRFLVQTRFPFSTTDLSEGGVQTGY